MPSRVANCFDVSVIVCSYQFNHSDPSGHNKFEIKVNASAARAAEHAGAAAAAATTTASVGDKTTDPTKLDQAVKELQQKYSQLEKKKLDAKAKLDNACDNETKRALQVEFATANIASAGAKKDWEAALHFRRQMLTNKFQFDHKKGTVVKSIN